MHNEYNRLKICFYLSDHGFGHICRNIPIIAEVAQRAEQVFVVCGKKHIEFAKDNLKDILAPKDYIKLIFRSDRMDIGLILKPGTLLVDNERLEKECMGYLNDMPKRICREASWLRKNGITRAVCDMPLFSIEACKRANVPLLYIGNFTWTELYKEHLPKIIWEKYAAEYRKLEHVLLYALHNTEMLEYVGNAGDIHKTSMTVRPFNQEKAKEIKALHDRPLVFIALGMSAEFEKEIYAENFPYDFIVNQGVPLVGSNVIRLDVTVQNTQDYVLASDYVISKAGWGTVSEAVLGRKPLALFARDTVLEDRTTINILKEQRLAISVTEDDLTDIPGVIDRMDRELSADRFSDYYDAAEEIAGYITGNKGGF